MNGLAVYVGPCTSSNAAGIVVYSIPALGVQAVGIGTLNENVTERVRGRRPWGGFSTRCVDRNARFGPNAAMLRTGTAGIGSYVRASRLLQSMLGMVIVVVLALLTLHAIVGVERRAQHAQRVLEGPTTSLTSVAASPQTDELARAPSDR